jgi:hypothetical protein
MSGCVGCSNLPADALPWKAFLSDYAKDSNTGNAGTITLHIEFFRAKLEAVPEEVADVPERICGARA